MKEGEFLWFDDNISEVVRHLFLTIINVSQTQIPLRSFATWFANKIKETLGWISEENLPAIPIACSVKSRCAYRLLDHDLANLLKCNKKSVLALGGMLT